MEIPDEIMMTATLFADMAKGGYIQHYRNNEYGISVTVSAETRRGPLTKVFMIDCLPDQEFDSLKALQEAVAEIET